jgi:mono/diheme cytochrome c family protein
MESQAVPYASSHRASRFSGARGPQEEDDMNRRMLTGWLMAGALVLLPGAMGWKSSGAQPEAAGQAKTPVERGQYLVTAMGCNDCHTPWQMGPKGPEPDMTRMLSGHPADMKMPPPPKLPEGPWLWLAAATNTAFAGPWGVSFSANLTPDPETGLGKWTPEIFIATLRSGRHEGKGRPILPPMPYFAVNKLNDEDLRAVFAYLQSLKPIRNRVPDPVDPPEEGR